MIIIELPAGLIDDIVTALWSFQEGVTNFEKATEEVKGIFKKHGYELRMI